MTGKKRAAVWGLILVGALFFLGSGFHRVTIFHLVPAGTVFRRPFGPEESGVGRAVGLDGRLYGPLSFALSQKHLAVADTYQRRILYLGYREATIAAANMMVEDIALDSSGAVLVADNRHLAVWRLGNGTAREIVHLNRQTGYTEAIWHLNVGPKGHIFVEWVRFGKGTFAVALNVYSENGRFIRRLAFSQGGKETRLTPLQGYQLDDALRTFQVAPNGKLYVEPPSASLYQRRIRIYRANGDVARDILVTSSEKIRHSELLGVNRQGWIYLGVNLTVPGAARVLVVSTTGQTVATIPVHAVPVYAAVYGRVGAGGDLYLDQSTSLEYQIRRWQLTSRRVWRWRLPFTHWN